MIAGPASTRVVVIRRDSPSKGSKASMRTSILRSNNVKILHLSTRARFLTKVKTTTRASDLRADYNRTFTRCWRLEAYFKEVLSDQA